MGNNFTQLRELSSDATAEIKVVACTPANMREQVCVCVCVFLFLCLSVCLSLSVSLFLSVCLSLTPKNLHEQFLIASGWNCVTWVWPGKVSKG